MVVPSAVLGKLLLACPTVWQAYLQACSGDGHLNFTSAESLLGVEGLAQRSRSSDAHIVKEEDSAEAIENCDHRHFGCFYPGVAGRQCRSECPIGVVFATYQVLLNAFTHWALEDARSLVTNLVHLRELLPEACHGWAGGGCSPLLPAGWFEEASAVLHEWLQKLALQEMLPVSREEQQLATARRIAVVSAFYSPKKTLPSSSSPSSSISPSGRLLWGEGLEDVPFPWYFHNKRCYCERHGYTFVFDTSPPDVNLHTELDNYQYELHWTKLSAIRRALKSFDWVFWIDHDALFANVSLPLHTFLDRAESESSPDLIVQDSYQLPGLGAFFIRNTPWSWHFLDTWERFGQQAGERGKMWELRTFNCALVHMLLILQTGSGIRRCSEFAHHVALLRSLLEIHNVSHQSRQSQRAFGKIYFWNPISQSPRGFLFNSNDPEQQRHFPGEDLYHIGDLSVHWPKPDKGTKVMRSFANEQEHLEGCERWLFPKQDLEDVYQPTGSALEPPLYSPEIVLKFAQRWVSLHQAAVLALGPEGVQPLQHISTTGGWRYVDVLHGDNNVPKQIVDAFHYRRLNSISDLPVSARYDLIYASLRIDATLQDLKKEVTASLLRLLPGGLLVIPVEHCGHSEQAGSALVLENFVGGGWHITRTAGALDLGGVGLGCRWAYLSRGISSEDYRKIAANAF